MDKCTKCKWEYPSNLLSELFVASEGQRISISVCGICALETRNELYGFTDKKFDAPIAEHIRQLAVKWRKKHPTLKPVVN